MLADEPVSNLYQATAQGVLDALCETTAAAGAVRFVLPAIEVTEGHLEELCDTRESAP